MTERRRLFVYTITVLVVIAAITVSLYWCLPACSPEERMALLSTRFLFLMASLALAVICLLFSWIRHWERKIKALTPPSPSVSQASQSVSPSHAPSSSPPS